MLISGLLSWRTLGEVLGWAKYRLLHNGIIALMLCVLVLWLGFRLPPRLVLDEHDS